MDYIEDVLDFIYGAHNVSSPCTLHLFVSECLLHNKPSLQQDLSATQDDADTDERCNNDERECNVV